MGTRMNWLLVVMLVGITSAGWIPHTDHLNRVVRQNVADETEKAGEHEVELREEMTSMTTDASVEETSIPTFQEVTLTPAVDTLDEESRTLDDAKSEVQVSDLEHEESTTTSAETETTAQSTDAQPVTEITPQVKGDLPTDEEQTTTQSFEEDSVTEKQVINETFRKVQLKKVSAEMEDVDAIQSFHQPRSTTSSPPASISTSRPLKLPTKLLDFLKNQLKTRGARTTTTTAKTISTSTESLPTVTENRPSSPTRKVFGARIISRTPGAGDELTVNSPRISRARFFASASSLLSGFVPAVPSPEREGRAKSVKPIAYKSASMDELFTSTDIADKSSKSPESTQTSVVRVPPRRKPKPPAPLPPVTIVKPESPQQKRTALSRLSKRFRVKPKSSTKSEDETSTPATLNNIKNVENAKKNNFLRNFKIRDMKSKLTHTKTT